jgi:hypothetical protein
MKKVEIDALLRAHRGNARPVAFFHVLRQPALSPDDHAFLTEHIEALGATDLHRWRARCEPGHTGVVIRRLAELAIRDPGSFEHEVLGVPRLVLEEEEWRELLDLTRGKVPEALHAHIAERGRRPPRESQSTWMFSPRVIPSNEPFFFEEDEHLAPDVDGRPLRDLSLAAVLAARAAGKLTMSDEALAALASERARTSEEDWSLAVVDFPEVLRDAVLEKARRARTDSERANLLFWLDARGTPRATTLDIALSAVRAGRYSEGILHWLSGQLTTRAAWEKHGFEALSALADRRAFAGMSRLVTVAWSEAGRGGKEPPRGLLDAIQGALALVLVGLTRQSLTAGEPDRALAALSALACLDPPSRVSRAVHELTRLPGLTPEITELIAVNERLVKHSDARDASLEGVIAALHAIADAFN